MFMVNFALNLIYTIETVINDYLIGVPYRWVMSYQRYWLVPVTVLGVLVISLGLGVVNDSRLTALMIVLPFLIGGGLLLLRWPPLGFIALIASIVIPFNGPGNFNVTFMLAAVLFGWWLLDIILKSKTFRFVPSMTYIPLTGLVISALASFAIGQLNFYLFVQHAPTFAQVAGLMLYLLSAALFIIVPHRLTDLKWLKWMVWTFLGVASLNVIGWISPRPIASFTEYLFGYSGASGSLFWTWLFTLAFTNMLFNRKLRLEIRVALALLFLATLYVMIVNFWEWNSGWMPPLVSVGTIMFFAFPRLGGLGLLAGLMAMLIQLQSVIASVMVGDNEYSLSTRLEAWVIVLDISRVNPIFGLGPSNYYFYTTLFPIRGYAVQFNSHQQYVDLIAQTGILGLLFFCLFFIAVGYVSWRLTYRIPKGGFVEAYVYAGLGGVAGTFAAAAFGDWVIPFYYNINVGGFRASMLSWLFLGGIIYINYLVRSGQLEGVSKEFEDPQLVDRLADEPDHQVKALGPAAGTK